MKIKKSFKRAGEKVVPMESREGIAFILLESLKKKNKTIPVKTEKLNSKRLNKETGLRAFKKVNVQR